MVKITIVSPEGRQEIDAPEGTTLMWNAVQNNVPGIVGECGGQLSCATCHVYVSEEWRALMRPPSFAETELLEVLDSISPDSRLSCQIDIEAALDGLCVEPAPQL